MPALWLGKLMHRDRDHPLRLSGVRRRKGNRSAPVADDRRDIESRCADEQPWKNKDAATLGANG
ncbi:hypothetical protein ACGFK1_01055 [Mycobacterium sp. NPDC048908]|uniref:hypothetical protein n=1 Tax=Mycobacterium sp. NPDC048908 TaxID=3364292 RepID=UPI0037204D7E